MIINFKGNETYIGTGGRSLDSNKSTICFLHGSGQNHLSFVQQARFFAFSHGKASESFLGKVFDRYSSNACRTRAAIDIPGRVNALRRSC